MAQRPHLHYPPAAVTAPGHAATAPHPPAPRAAPPAGHGPAAGDTAVAPVVTYVDPDPPPVTGWRGAGPQLPHRRPRRPSRVAALLALAALVLLLIVLAHLNGIPGSGGTISGNGTISGSGTVTGGSAGDGTQRAPAHAKPPQVRFGSFTLPGPEGTVPRTVPLETIWIIDAALPAADLAAFSREAPADVAYLARYALRRDQLGFEFRPRPLLRVIASEPALADTAAHPARIVIAQPGGPVRLPPVSRGHDRAIVVITANPVPWLAGLPAVPTPPAPAAGSRPGQTRTYIVDLTPGIGPQADPLNPSRTQPQLLIADPQVRGGIARAIARAFVDAIGSAWPA
jgi:hypothetical protein